MGVSCASHCIGSIDCVFASWHCNSTSKKEGQVQNIFFSKRGAILKYTNNTGANLDLWDKKRQKSRIFFPKKVQVEIEILRPNH